MTGFRERRRALGLTQAQLAAELDVSVLTIKRLEKARAIARLYELAIEALELRHRAKEGGEVQP